MWRDGNRILVAGANADAIFGAMAVPLYAEFSNVPDLRPYTDTRVFNEILVRNVGSYSK